MHGFALPTKNSLTILSSSEWKLMTAKIPPLSSSSKEAGNALARLCNSSFTSMRRAWNTLRAGLPAANRAGVGMESLMVSTSSEVRR